MKEIIFRPSAVHDLAQHAEYFANVGETVVLRFLRNVHATTDVLASFPLHGRPRPELSTVKRTYRSIAIAGLPNHLIVYRAQRKSVVVVRVVHGASDHRSWLKR